MFLKIWLKYSFYSNIDDILPTNDEIANSRNDTSSTNISNKTTSSITLKASVSGILRSKNNTFIVVHKNEHFQVTRTNRTEVTVTSKLLNIDTVTNKSQNFTHTNIILRNSNSISDPVKKYKHSNIALHDKMSTGKTEDSKNNTSYLNITTNKILTSYINTRTPNIQIHRSSNNVTLVIHKNKTKKYFQNKQRNQNKDIITSKILSIEKTNNNSHHLPRPKANIIPTTKSITSTQIKKNKYVNIDTKKISNRTFQSKAPKFQNQRYVSSKLKTTKLLETATTTSSSTILARKKIATVMSNSKSSSSNSNDFSKDQTTVTSEDFIFLGGGEDDEGGDDNDSNLDTSGDNESTGSSFHIDDAMEQGLTVNIHNDDGIVNTTPEMTQTTRPPRSSTLPMTTPIYFEPKTIATPQTKILKLDKYIDIGINFIFCVLALN